MEKNHNIPPIPSSSRSNIPPIPKQGNVIPPIPNAKPATPVPPIPAPQEKDKTVTVEAKEGPSAVATGLATGLSTAVGAVIGTVVGASAANAMNARPVSDDVIVADVTADEEEIDAVGTEVVDIETTTDTTNDDINITYYQDDDVTYAQNNYDPDYDNNANVDNFFA